MSMSERRAGTSTIREFVRVRRVSEAPRQMKLLRITAIILLLWPSVPSWANDDQAAPATSGPARSDLRFEGYLFSDVEGKPIPLQTDDEIGEFLATAEIAETRILGTGITLPLQVVLVGGGFRVKAIFKDVDIQKHKITDRINGRSRFSLDWRDWHGYDAAAFRLDRLLGNDRVPPAVGRTIRGTSGTISIWLENTINEFERSGELHISPPDEKRWNQQLSMMQVYDNLVANRDSNLGNRLIDTNWRLWFIDCTRCFGTTRVMYYPLEEIRLCERGFWNGLKALDAERIAEHLSPYLSKAEMKALSFRRDIIVEHFQKLIDERGEAKVLFDVSPPTETAPWAED